MIILLIILLTGCCKDIRVIGKRPDNVIGQDITKIDQRTVKIGSNQYILGSIKTVNHKICESDLYIVNVNDKGIVTKQRKANVSAVKKINVPVSPQHRVIMLQRLFGDVGSVQLG